MNWKLACAGALILSACIAASLPGMDWGLPWRWNPDELTRPGDLLLDDDANPEYHYGTHHRRLAGALVTPYLRACAGSPDADLGEMSTRPEPHTGMVLRLRAFGAVESGLAVVIVFLICADLAGLPAALLVALVLTLLPVRVVTSHFATIDSPLLLWSMLSLGALYFAVRNRCLRWYRVAAFAVGLAATTKPVGGLLLLALALAPLAILPERPGVRGLFRCWAPAALACVAGILVGCPEIITDARAYWRQNLVNPVAVKQAIRIMPGYEWWMTPERWARGWGGWPWAIIAVCGSVACMRDRDARLARFAQVVVPWALAVCVYFTLWPTGDVRNSLCAGVVLSAFGAVCTSRALLGAPGTARRVLALVALCAALVHLGVFALRSEGLFALDPRNRLERWLGDHGAPGQMVEHYCATGLNLPSGMRSRSMPTPGLAHWVHPTETALAPLFEFYHKRVRGDWDAWMSGYREAQAEIRREAERAAQDLTREALTARDPHWIVVDTDSLTLIEHGKVPFPEGARFQRELLAGRLGPRVVASFGPPFAYAPDFLYPPTSHMTVYVLAAGH